MAIRKIVSRSIDLDVIVAEDIAANAVTAAEIGSNAVTNTKIQDGAVTTSKITDANVTTSKIADANITNAKLASTAVSIDKVDTTVSQMFGLKNMIINGDFRFWQRGTSVTAGSGYQKLYQADRFYIEGSAISGTTYSLTSLTYNGVFEDAVQIVPTGTTYFFQGVERAFRDLTGRTVTFSFVATGSGSVNVITWDPTNTTVTRATITLSGGSTPTKYSATFTCPTWGGAGQQDLYVGLQLSSGVTYKFTQFQLEQGSTATPFERRPMGMEIEMCKRYYQQQGMVMAKFHSPGAGTSRTIDYILSPEMRATPTVVVDNAGEFSSISTTNRLGNSSKLVCIEGTVGNSNNYGFVGSISFSSEL